MEELMDPVPSLAERIESVGTIAGMAAVVLVIGMALLWLIGRGSPSRAYHGRFVLTWMVTGWVVCGLIGSAMVDNNRYLWGETDIGSAGFGLLGGWAMGMTHGAIALRSNRPSPRPGLLKSNRSNSTRSC